MRFLLIEDNQNLSSAVSERLSLDGHVVDQAESLGIANHYLSVSSYDLILLDIMLQKFFLKARNRIVLQVNPILVFS